MNSCVANVWNRLLETKQITCLRCTYNFCRSKKIRKYRDVICCTTSRMIYCQRSRIYWDFTYVKIPFCICQNLLIRRLAVVLSLNEWEILRKLVGGAMHFLLFCLLTYWIYYINVSRNHSKIKGVWALYNIDMIDVQCLSILEI